MAGVKHRPHVAAPHDTPRSRLRSLWPPWVAQMTAVATSAHRFRTPEKRGTSAQRNSTCLAISSAVAMRHKRTRLSTTCPSRRCLAGQKTTPACGVPALDSTMKSLSHVTNTRPCGCADASYCKSEAPWSSCSTVVVTSTPRSLRPAATAASMCSSRWYLISTRHPLRSTSPTTAAGQEPGTCFRFQL